MHVLSCVRGLCVSDGRAPRICRIFDGQPKDGRSAGLGSSKERGRRGVLDKHDPALQVRVASFEGRREDWERR
jgi:hypothetical protein